MFSVRDPVHGFIRATDLEANIISSRPSQRLRSIRQLGLTHLVFPGAEHSRFAHTLGAMHLAGRLYDALAEIPLSPLDRGVNSAMRQQVRVAALLHDVGHAPFSHSAESLFDGPIDHEEMSRRIALSAELSPIFESHNFDPAPVVEILSGQGKGVYRLLGQMISSELDVDKMDYLLRDSLFCGVEYGRFDLDRILDTVRPILDPETDEWGIGIDLGGVHAFEALVLARYYMFTQVYFNVTGKVLELHLNQWLQEEGVRWPSEVERFLQLDDVDILHRMRGSESVHARAVTARERYRLVHETREQLGESARRDYEDHIKTLQEEFGPDRILVSRAFKDPHHLDRSRLMVRGNDGKLLRMEHASQFISRLPPIDRYRIYAHPSLAKGPSAERIRESLP